MKRPSANQLRIPAPIRKARTIHFAEEIAPNPEQHSIDVAYDLHDHSLEELEEILVDKGFHLDCTLLTKMIRALYYYVEETELHNLEAPERLLKKSQNEAYIQAWERHPHGDHDDTPPEWREYK